MHFTLNCTTLHFDLNYILAYTTLCTNNTLYQITVLKFLFKVFRPSTYQSITVRHKPHRRHVSKETRIPTSSTATAADTSPVHLISQHLHHRFICCSHSEDGPQESTE